MGKTNGFRSLGMYYGLAFALGTALLVDAGYKFLSKKPLKEPTRQEFKSDVLNLENEFLWDIDGDGCVDLITDRGDICWVRFYKPGFDKMRTGCRLMPNYSLPMSSNLEEVATAMLKNSQELRYQEVKARYDFIQNKK